MLEDHEEERRWAGVLWARDVRIQGYVVVEGRGLVGGLGVGAGSYVVWNCEVQTLDGGVVVLRKR